MNNKSSIVTISKNEHLYLNEWIDYHLNLGIDKIIIFDNNDKENLSQYKIISTYSPEHVVYIDYRGKTEYQLYKAYQEAYDIYRAEFDWIVFLDIDEFLFIPKHFNLHEFLNDISYSKTDLIEIKRIYYGDNNLISGVGSVLERFSVDINAKALDGSKYIFNSKSKNTKTIKFLTRRGFPAIKDGFMPSSSVDLQISSSHYSEYSKINDIIRNCIHIKHFESKSFAELLTRLKNGSPYTFSTDQFSVNRIEQKIKKYFLFHPITEQKTHLLNAEFGQILPPHFMGINNYDQDYDIDYIFPYVDGDDPVWQKLFEEYYVKDFDNDTCNGSVRCITHDFLRYKMRCLEKNMNWVKNVYMIVACPSQVPEWMDTTQLKIVYHKDFIPEEFLPVFSSSTIELFMHRIPGLSERFIYSNDDFYPTMRTSPDMFFRRGIPCLTCEKRNNRESKYKMDVNRLFDIYVENNMKLASADLNMVVDSNNLWNPLHNDKPHLKSVCEKIHVQYGDIIYNNITKFREPLNYMQYLYVYYNICHGNYISYAIPNLALQVGSPKHVEKTERAIGIIHNENSLLSIDFSIWATQEQIDSIREELHKKYPNNSKYEL
jgi:hypothetical protein